MRLLSALALLLPLAAFAGLDDLSIETSLREDYVIAVAGHDQREFVLSGESEPSIVGGYIKGIFRTRAHTFTNSDLPVADAIAEGLRKVFLRQKWLGATSIATAARDSKADIVARLKLAGLPRSMLVTVEDLWSESYRNTTVNYRFRVEVFDATGRVLAQSVLDGTHDTREWGDDAAAEIFSKRMTALLATPEFLAALKRPS